MTRIYNNIYIYIFIISRHVSHAILTIALPDGIWKFYSSSLYIHHLSLSGSQYLISQNRRRKYVKKNLRLQFALLINNQFSLYQRQKYAVTYCFVNNLRS